MPFPTITSLDFFIVTPVGVRKNKKGVRTVRRLCSQHTRRDAIVFVGPIRHCTGPTMWPTVATTQSKQTLCQKSRVRFFNNEIGLLRLFCGLI
ncbi:hypothetical protein [Acidovorax delafieldii]|uniref:hypothetical protein n=1 Tax=Acidovorax delafieldii TaxID=47920 RepID=UPI0018E0707C|nr:hypothetical protein [Acidovorax delafieldii]